MTIFKNLIDSFSSLNRLLNYSVLVSNLVDDSNNLDLDIYNTLLQGDSVNSFTKYIQESQYSNRFDMKKYIFEVISSNLYKHDDYLTYLKTND